MIPEAAVVAATKVLFADNISNHAGDNAPQIIDVCEKVARRALEAANLPLLALVRDQAAKLAKVETDIDGELQDAPPSNYEEDNYDAGYIAGLTYAQDLLRAALEATP